MQTLAGNRLLELHQTQEDNLILSKELGDLEVVTLICSAGLAFLYFKLDPVFSYFTVLCMQGQLRDEKYVLVSKPYMILNDKLQHLNAEIDRYRGLVEVLQVWCLSYVILLCIAFVLFFPSFSSLCELRMTRTSSCKGRKKFVQNQNQSMVLNKQLPHMRPKLKNWKLKFRYSFLKRMILKPRLRRLCKIQVEGTRTMCTLFKEGGGGDHQLLISS